MTDEINENLPPECSQCNDYIEVQKIKTKRIKELQHKLEVAVRALEFYGSKKHIVCCYDVNWVEPTESEYNMYDVNYIEEGNKARQALNEIKEGNEG